MTEVGYRAIRAERLEVVSTHWDDGDGWTTCGHRIAAIAVIDRLVLAELPDDGCAKCLELRHRTPRRELLSITVSRPAPGRLIKTGPINHGPSSRVDRGQRIYPDE